MTKADKAKLDQICAEAFARLDAMDDFLWQRGFIGKPQNDWSLKGHVESAPGAGKRYGLRPSATVLSPTPAPLLPSQGAFAN